jgi:hypothetical protein
MKTFVLRRHVDVSGVSGTGDVAEGIEFSDGTVALRWVVGEHPCTSLWDSIDSVTHIHGHGSHTEIVWTGSMKDHKRVDVELDLFRADGTVQKEVYRSI